MESAPSLAYQAANVRPSATLKITVLASSRNFRLSVRMSVSSVPNTLMSTTASQHTRQDDARRDGRAFQPEPHVDVEEVRRGLADGRAEDFDDPKKIVTCGTLLSSARRASPEPSRVSAGAGLDSPSVIVSSFPPARPTRADGITPHSRASHVVRVHTAFVPSTIFAWTLARGGLSCTPAGA